MEFKTYDFFDQFFNSPVAKKKELLFHVPNNYRPLYSIRYLLMLYLILHPEYSSVFAKYANIGYKCSKYYCLIWQDYVSVASIQSDIEFISQLKSKKLISKQDYRSKLIYSLSLFAAGKGYTANPYRIEIYYDDKPLVSAAPVYKKYESKYDGKYIQIIELDRKNLVEIMQELLDKYGITILKLAAFPVRATVYENPYTWITDNLYYQFAISNEILDRKNKQFTFDDLLIPIRFVVPEDGELKKVSLSEVSSVFNFTRKLARYFGRKIASKNKILAEDKVSEFSDALELLCFMKLREYWKDKFNSNALVDACKGSVIVNTCFRTALNLHPLFAE